MISTATKNIKCKVTGKTLRRCPCDDCEAYRCRQSVTPQSAELLTPEEIDFMLAMDRYKRIKGRPFPSCSEVLSVIKAMGYRRVAEAESI